MYLLDTMVISEESKNLPNPSVTAWFRQTEPNLLFLSVVSIGEIARGIAKQRRLNPPFARRLEGWLRRTELQFAERLLPFDIMAAKIWGELWDRLGLTGPDLLIASTALRHDLVVVTRNLRHFRDTGARLLNPFGPTS